MATLQDFEALVRSGAIEPDDLVHDSVTGEWARARTHPAYRVVVDALEESGGDPEDAGLSMKLVEENRRSREEDTEAFIERLERERKREKEARARGPSGSSEVFDVGLAESLARPMNEDLDDERERDWSTSVRSGPPSAGSSGAWDEPGDGAPAGRRRALGMLGVAVLALGVTAAVAHPAFRFPGSLPGIESAEEAEVPEEAPEFLSGPDPEEARATDVPRTDVALRAQAWDGFVERVDSLRQTFDLGRVPSVWLQGRYLAEASAHPEVEVFWTEYLRYVERVYAEEENLFRDAYLEAVEESGVTGPVRSLRLARATEDFRADAPGRRALYSGVWELAVTARSLHNVLVELEGDITWEPAVSGRLSADPVVEAAGRDEEAQARLDGALDRVLSAMYAVTDGGRDVRGQRPDWLARALAEGGWAEG